jgi:hypothetical protein
VGDVQMRRQLARCAADAGSASCSLGLLSGFRGSSSVVKAAWHGTAGSVSTGAVQYAWPDLGQGKNMWVMCRCGSSWLDVQQIVS